MCWFLLRLSGTGQTGTDRQERFKLSPWTVHFCCQETERFCVRSFVEKNQIFNKKLVSGLMELNAPFGADENFQVFVICRNLRKFIIGMVISKSKPKLRFGGYFGCVLCRYVG